MESELTHYHKKLEYNLKLYYIFKIFGKRVYLPLIAIFLVNDAKLTVTDIALIASITVFVQMFLDLPTGYLADKLGHKVAMLIGTFFSTLSPLAYLVAPNFAGGLAASLLFFGGYSFVGGALQAFIHDTLKALGKSSEYAKYAGRAQSYGLLGNMVLVALVPLTWSINHSLPFIIGIFASLICFIVVLMFTPPKIHSEHDTTQNVFHTFRQIPWPDLLFLLVMFGVVSATFETAPQYRELVFAHLGIPIAWFGFILALGSLCAAIAGRYVHRLADIKPQNFYLFDILFVSLVMVAIGFFTNPILSVIAFLFLPAYDRNRSIVAESHLLSKYPDHRYKATLLSVLDFYRRLNALWIPLVMAWALQAYGIQRGYLAFGFIILPILLILFAAHRLSLKPVPVKI